jgi:hypothetical protein
MADPIGNNIMEGALKVVDIDFDGVYMGRTTADTELVPEEDNQDIFYQQEGTKPADKIPTGMNYLLNCTFGEITNARLEKLLRGVSLSGTEQSAKFGRNIYTSRIDAAKELTVTAVDSTGTKSTDETQIATFWKASPEVTGSIVWGAATQRNLPVTFYIFYDDTNSGYGYYGYSSSLGL